MLKIANTKLNKHNKKIQIYFFKIINKMQFIL